MFNQVMNGLPFQTWSAYQSKLIQPLEPTMQLLTVQTLDSTKQKHQKQSALPIKDGSNTFSFLPQDHIYSSAMFHHLVCKNCDHLAKLQDITRVKDIDSIILKVPEDPAVSQMPHKTHLPESKIHKAQGQQQVIHRSNDRVLVSSSDHGKFHQ